MKSWIRNFFGFSRRETNAFLILLPLLFVLIFSEPIYRYWFVRQAHDYSKETKKLDSLMGIWKWDNDSVLSEKPEAKELFAFDPNHASKEELMGLGFSKSLAARIVNYRLKGGKFLVKNDLLKIYGMDSLLFKKLIPFIILPEAISKEKFAQKTEIKEKPFAVKFDLNKADTSQLIKIYGIGQKLSLRIIAYRDKLGGFISQSQLNEVYGLDSVVVKELLSKSFIEKGFYPRQVNINNGTEKDLGAHPYIKYKLAKAIVAYRAQHGPFASIDDLKKITILDEITFLRMKPYVTVH
jgi:competence protein ComEA